MKTPRTQPPAQRTAAAESILIGWWFQALQELVETGQIVVSSSYSQDSTAFAAVNNLATPTGAQS